MSKHDLVQPFIQTPHQRNLTGMLLAIGATGRHLYEGTVPAAVTAERRRKNRAARSARRTHRKAAQR
jgi:hypothetical protein